MSASRQQRQRRSHRARHAPGSEVSGHADHQAALLPPSRPHDPPPHILVLGTGFAAFSVLKNLDDRYRVTVVSPRNHFLFTPLLPGTTVGTIEFRSIIEPIRHARKSLLFYHAAVESLDPHQKRVTCAGATAHEHFTVEYDVLIIAVGSMTSTYNVPGVTEYAVFLKELNDARILRQLVIRNFERANLPTASDQERRRLLHFVICGGGPTGVEFAAELHDFLREDLRRSYPELTPKAKITVVEASEDILNTFDRKLRGYAEALFRRQEIKILTGSRVIRVTRDRVILKDRPPISHGLLLWSTGNGPTPFTLRAPLPKNPGGRIIVDEYFRVRGYRDIYSIGDCAVLENSPLPETAQVAQQQGKYLAYSLNRLGRSIPPRPFRYRHLGMLAYIGGNRALADLQNFKGHGWTTWIFWRSAYLTRVVSLKNKVLVLFDWMKARVFGRDVSQF